MKKKFSYKNIIFKGKRLAALCLFVVFGAGLAITSSMTGDIPVHDGDVLVDSLAVAEKEDKAGDKSSEGSFKEISSFPRLIPPLITARMMQKKQMHPSPKKK